MQRFERQLSVPGGEVTAWRIDPDAPADRTPMLFVHGGPGGNCDGFAVFEQLADERPVVMWDQLGSRRSTWSGTADELWTRDRFCAEVDAVRAAHDLDEVVLYGHSWGGWLSIDYLSRQPDGVAGAVLSSTSASYSSFQASIDRRIAELAAPMRDAVARQRAGGSLDDPDYHGAALEFYRRFVVRHVPGDAVAEQVLERQRSSEVFRHMQGADELHADGALASWSRVADLPTIDTPALVTVGRFDHLDEHCAAEIADGLANAELVLFEASSHCSHLEQPGDVVAAVRQFAAALDERLLPPEHPAR
ncbi:MAG: proline iminopeptidase-family hydrolase [Actinomycetota bacterium]